MAKSGPPPREAVLDLETRDPATAQHARAREGRSVLGLTIIYHPDVSRIGAEARLFERSAEKAVLSRVAPDFVHAGGAQAWPLADPFLSRTPLRLRLLHGAAEGSLAVSLDPGASEAIADGVVISGEHILAREALERGVVLELSSRVVLCLGHLAEARSASEPDLGLIGESEVMCTLRRTILRAASLPVPILLRGETGTGKELIARGIHSASPRRAGPCVSVSLAAIPPAVAASALFGHKQGAFTGAVEDHAGHFERAHGGTLFLDEIGEAPVEVQVMLLRALENGVIQRVGDGRETRVDVQLISATDADLELAVKSDRFRAPLLHRLAGFELRVPALRERRADFGRLFVRFLREELERLGGSDKLAFDPESEPWVPAPLVARLARYGWPGNVRQLRNVVRQLIVTNFEAPSVELDRSLDRQLAESGVTAPLEAKEQEAAPERRKPSDVGEEELMTALRSNRFRLDATAAELRISRTSLYALIDRSERLRKAKDIPDEELERAHRELGGDLEAMAERLEVSSRGLQLRLRALRS